MKKLTIKDIAQLAGVSYATVSRALTDSTEISSSTKERILSICREKGYQANRIAQSLSAKKSNVLGLILPDVMNPFYAELAFNIEIYARELGYHVMLCNSLHEQQMTIELLDFLIGQRVDGIILATSRYDDCEWLQKYSQTLPILLLGGSGAQEGVALHSVAIDNVAGGRLAAQYLLDLGHQNILYVGYRPSSLTHQKRLQGFQEEMNKRGGYLKIIINDGSDSSLQQGYHLGKNLFSTRTEEKFTAIFAATDSLALGIIEAAYEAKIQIPENISLLGFDNISYSQLPPIKLSTIDQRKKVLSHTAIDVLHDLILKGEEVFSFTRTLVQPQLVIRSSCRKNQIST